MMAAENSVDAQLMGKTLEDANEIIRELQILVNGERIKIIRPQVIDGEGLMTTCDYRQDRLNVEIRNSKIVKICGAN